MSLSVALMVFVQEAAGDSTLPALWDRIDLVSGLRAGAMVVVGLPLVFFLSRLTRRWATSQVSAQVGLIAGKLVFYAGGVTLLVTTMLELGFSLAPLLGAAGVVGIALGFASQTSVSNVIAGLFLIAEQPFIVDDIIQVGDITGVVLSVDTMSVKLRTFDNRFVRIPNETLFKSTVVNITRFPIRRVDVRIGVAYREDPDRVRDVLLDVADKNPLALMEPEPRVIFDGFGDSSVNFLFAVWAARENWLELKNTIQPEVKQRFDEEGIEIPFPHRSLYVGSESGAFPIRVVDDEAASGPLRSGPSVEDVASAEVGDDRPHEQGADPVA